MFRMFETSQHARLYAQHRTEPPASLISRVLQFVSSAAPQQRGSAAPQQRAVDVGCGTGQNTRLLAPHFASVLATDISPAQVAEAAASSPHDAVQYQVAPAEEIPAPDGSVQLVTASMCYHYFDRPRFLAEADRVLAPGGVIALYGYQEAHTRLEDGSVWTEFDDVVNNVRYVHLADHWGMPLQDMIGTYKEAAQLIRYPDVVWDEESHFHERPLSVDHVLGIITTWSGFHNMVKSCGAEQGDALLKKVRAELLAVIADGEKRGINTAAATDRRQCYLMMARKPGSAAVSGQ